MFLSLLLLFFVIVIVGNYII